MPLYDFQCPTCGYRVESFTRPDAQCVVVECDNEPAVCTLNRVPSAPRVVIPAKHRAA